MAATTPTHGEPPASKEGLSRPHASTPRTAPQTIDDVRSLAAITVDDVCRLVPALGRNQVYAMIHRGELPHRRAGKRLLIPAGSFLSWAGYDKAPP